MMYHMADGGYLSWVYGSSTFRVNSWPPQTIRRSLLMMDSLDDTFRKQRDSTYKENRVDKRFEDPRMYAAWQRVREIRRSVIEDPRLTVVRVPGLEADDLLALGGWLFGKQSPVCTLAIDKDLLQIPELDLYKMDETPVTMQSFQARLAKALQTRPLPREHIPLILALLGDKSDNIPRLVESGGLWRVFKILHDKKPWDLAYKSYKSRFLKNLYQVILPDPHVFGWSKAEVFDTVRSGLWNRQLLSALKPEYKKEVKSWRTMLSLA